MFDTHTGEPGGPHILQCFPTSGLVRSGRSDQPLPFFRILPVRNTKYDVLITIQAILKRYQGNWCYASRQKTIQLLAKFHNVKIRYRMLGYHLADLRDAGLIKTYRRTHRRDDGTLCLLTSARCLTIKGCKYLLNRGVTWAQHHLNKLKLKYIPPQPGQPNNHLNHTVREEVPEPSGESPFLDPGHRRRFGLPDAPPFDPKKA